jgi:4-hydroxybenzoyl-CoA thioesterase
MAYLTFRRALTIEWGHCDPAGIVFNAHFFQFFDWSTWLMFESVLGVKPAELFEAFDIAGIPLVDVRAQFRKPALFGDLITIESRVREFRRSSFDVEHRIWLAGECVVEGQETRVWVGRDRENPDQLRARPIRGEVVERFKLG